MSGLKASWTSYILNFNFIAKTSRDELKQRTVWFIQLENSDGMKGIGECAMLKGLSFDDLPNFEKYLNEVCEQINESGKIPNRLEDWPSIQFALETALLSLKSANSFELFPSEFTKGNQGIPINGLVWMGNKDFMKSQLSEKLEAGFKCIKLKIGAINWTDELEILQGIRREFSRSEIEIRVDANGAFNPQNVMAVLESLAELEVHSIEQPIKAGQWKELGQICEQSPVPIALDEELIPLRSMHQKRELFESLKPQYLVLKPSLHGGMAACEEWIELANSHHCDFWITSALESNIGLNAIAQWVTSLKPGHIFQGLGTGQLYSNNIESPLEINNAALYYNPTRAWTFDLFKS